MLIYVAFGKLVIHKLYKGIPFVKTAIDLPVIGFYSVVLLSILVNGSPLMGSLYNIRPLARYIVLFYLVANSSLSERKITTFLRHNPRYRYLPTRGRFYSVGRWSRCISISSYRVRINARHRWIYKRISDYLRLGREIGSIYGTLGDTVIYGIFMILVLIVYLSRIRQLEYLNLLGAAVLFFFIARSYSRAATFSALLAGGAWYYFHYGWKKTLQLAGVTTCTGLRAVIGSCEPIQS